MTASTTDTGDATIALARLISLALALLSLVWLATDRPFWSDGVNVPVVPPAVAALTTVLVGAACAVAVWLRGRARLRSVLVVLRTALLVAQAAWATFSAAIIFAYSEFGGATLGWGVMALAWAVALGILVASWWLEDRLARHRTAT